MLRRSIISGAITVFVSALPGCPDSSGHFESKRAEFAIKFDVKPQVKQEDSPAPEFARTFQIVGKSGGMFAAVSAAEATEEFSATLRERGLIAAIEHQKKRYFEKPDTKFYSAKDIKLAGSEIPGFEVVTTSDERQFFRMRAIVTERWMYQIFVMGSRTMVESASATEFMNSFRLLPSK